MNPVLLTPKRMLEVIPGEVTVEGTVDLVPDHCMSLRGYRFLETEVFIPSMRDYQLVRWKQGTPRLGFCDGHCWQVAQAAPGDITLLARAEPSRWFWANDIEVSHVYISQSVMAKVAQELFQREIDGIFIDHCPVVRDTELSGLIEAYERECLSDQPGHALYTQTLEIQICIHLLRRYGGAAIKRSEQGARLPAHTRHQLQDYIDANLSSALTIKDLAKVAGFSASQFIRVFTTEFGTPPHRFVQARRLKKAERLLSQWADIPLKAVAMECGFSDQSHMTRLFKEKLSMTPKQYRGQTSLLGRVDGENRH
ncbi:helix-turn-helix domain-containing protein [Pseudomonas putida]|jgi:AraC family transcriptional regulator|uniref:helix-turn-helix domain-containing protein n=1 Tax=Pseudomonas putida TaxID=303 RepID=UPI000E6B22A3|nr:AraC family transcriptional regulator [Pseudomonas putida]RIZ40593.1 transcriptional regulator [Pseudomonas putida]